MRLFVEDRVEVNRLRNKKHMMRTTKHPTIGLNALLPLSVHPFRAILLPGWLGLSEAEPQAKRRESLQLETARIRLSEVVATGGSFGKTRPYPVMLHKETDR